MSYTKLTNNRIHDKYMVHLQIPQDFWHQPHDTPQSCVCRNLCFLNTNGSNLKHYQL